MPQLDLLFERARTAPKAFDGAQCYEADVVTDNASGVYVVLPNFSRTLRWGPCQPPDAAVAVGDSVSVVISEDGVPWLVGAGGGGGEPGPVGPQGPAGPPGTTGPQGPIGPPSTVPGPAGPQGVKGDTGAVGPQGAVGPAGPQGVAGPTGAIGPQGPSGATGPFTYKQLHS